MSNNIFRSGKYDFPQKFISQMNFTYFVKSIEAHTNAHCQIKQITFPCKATKLVLQLLKTQNNY